MKNLSLLILTMLISGVTMAQFSQTDWSGGGGQAVFNDPTQFNYSYHVDYNSVAGDLIADNTSKTHMYGVVEYQGRLLVSTAWSGTFIFDPETTEWEFSHIAPLIYYKNTTIHTDGKLYVMHGFNVFRYDGTYNDYGMGPNGWELHSNLKSLSLNSIYTIKSVQGKLLIGCRGGYGISNYTARVIEWNESTGNWQQMGNTFTNGVCSLVDYNGTIYAGTHWAGTVYKWTGSSWVYAFDTRSMSIMDMEVHDGYLYLGGSWDDRWGELYRYNGNSCQTIQYFSGYGVNELQAHNDVLTLGLRPRYNSTAPSKGILQYDGSSVSTLYNFQGEIFCANICSFDGNLYYGGIWGASTSVLYKNGEPFESVYVKGVISSEFATVNGILNYDATTEPGNGVKLFAQGKNDPAYQTNTWVEVPNGGQVNLTQDIMRYWAILYTIGEGTTPVLHEVRIGEGVVAEPLELNIVAQTDVSCFGGENGAAQVEAVGGVEPYTFNFNGQNVNSLNNLTAGTYTVSVADNQGESASITFTISQPELLQLSLSSPLYESGYNISCKGMNDGSIISTTEGGVPPYTFNWSNNGNTPNLSALYAGVYSVEVIDANNCIATAEITLTEPLPVVADAGVDVLVYYGYDPMASTQLLATGGASYSWFPTEGLSNPEIPNPVASPNEPTVYTVTVTDEFGCSSADDVFVDVKDVRCGKKLNKVLLCHNDQTICVSQNAVAAHLEHGDVLGECDEGLKMGSFVDSHEMGLEISAYPNPFNTECHINVINHEDSHLKIQVFDVQGRIVKEIYDGFAKTGSYSFTWKNSETNKTGMYFVRIIHKNAVETIKLFKE